MNDLSEVLFPEEVREGFVVKDLGSANWAMTKAARAEQRIQEKELEAAAMNYKIAEWLDRSTKEDRRTVESMGELLRPYVTVEIAKTGKARHVKLLHGDVGFRSTPGRLEVEDEAAALVWAKEHEPAAVKVVESVLKTPLMAHIKEKGEIPDGCKVLPGEERFYLKTHLDALPKGEDKLAVELKE